MTEGENKESNDGINSEGYLRPPKEREVIVSLSPNEVDLALGVSNSLPEFVKSAVDSKLEEVAEESRPANIVSFRPKIIRFRARERLWPTQDLKRGLIISLSVKGKPPA